MVTILGQFAYGSSRYALGSDRYHQPFRSKYVPSASAGKKCEVKIGKPRGVSKKVNNEYEIKVDVAKN